LLRGWHRDDGERLANTEVTFLGGDGEGRRRAASYRGGGAPMKPRKRWDARKRALKQLACSSPSRGLTGRLPNGGQATDERRRDGLLVAAG
jgi:hypothetical protein